MSARFVIDALDFVRNAGAHHGKITPVEFVRLQDYLTDSQGWLEYTISGVIGSEGKPLLRITVQGEINLQCQRCLASMVHLLDLKTDILLARDENELSRFDEDDSVDGVLAVPGMDVLELIEDEVILSLPISARHPEGKCSTSGPVGEDVVGREHLFAALAVLKKLH